MKGQVTNKVALAKSKGYKLSGGYSKSTKANTSKHLVLKRKIRIVLFSLIALFVVISGFVFFVYLSYGDDVLSVNEINATIGVSDYIGFNLDKDKLHFGTAFPGGASLRELTLTSEKSGYMYITINPEFEDWAYVSSQNIYVKEDEPVFVQIRMFVPTDAVMKNYTFGMKVFVLEKKADFITDFILGVTPINSDISDFSGAGSAKVQLEIVNNSKN